MTDSESYEASRQFIKYTTFWLVLQWWSLVLAVLNFCVLLPESWLISKMDLMEIGCEDGRWMELA
jgi:hypothetical protein